jgi:hypothetical protein
MNQNQNTIVNHHLELISTCPQDWKGWTKEKKWHLLSLLLILAVSICALALSLIGDTKL